MSTRRSTSRIRRRRRRSSGPYAHAWSDIDDDDAAGAAEEVDPAASSPGPRRSRASTAERRPATATPRHQCSWDARERGRQLGRRTASRTRSRPSGTSTASTTTSRRAPIGFDAASVQLRRARTALDVADRRRRERSPAAAPGRRPPQQREHGHAARRPARRVMQMYLFDELRRPASPFRDVNGGDDAVDRLPRVHARPVEPPVTDATGAGALDTRAGRRRWARRGATGTPRTSSSTRARRRHAPPTARSTWAPTSTRGRTRSAPQPLDCPVGVGRRGCPGAATRRRRLHVRRLRRARRRPARGPHADGEIWGETLWDLRNAARLRRRRGDHHRRDAPVAAAALVPRRAQRDPAGRHAALRRDPHQHALGRLRQPRHGLRRLDRGPGQTRRRVGRFDLPPVAASARAGRCRRRDAAGGARERRGAARRSLSRPTVRINASTARGRATRHRRLLVGLPRDRDDDRLARHGAVRRPRPHDAPRTRHAPARRSGTADVRAEPVGRDACARRAPAGCSRWA